MALEDKKLPKDAVPDERIAAAILDKLREDKLACADGFAIARALDVEPITVGQTADLMETRLTRCQLGLFGYPDKHGWRDSGVDGLDTPDGLEAAIVEAGDPEGRITCAEMWRLAGEFGISRMQMGWVVDQLGVKIISCQLGAF